MKKILIRSLSFYRWFISPALHALAPGGCKFHPTCSQYAIEAVEAHGAARGGWLALLRLARCHPFTRGGFDPVPLSSTHAAPTSPSGDLVTLNHDPLP